jgi:hypothetical protein
MRWNRCTTPALVTLGWAGDDRLRRSVRRIHRVVPLGTSPPGAQMSESWVYWLEGGELLHRRANCKRPGVLRQLAAGKTPPRLLACNMEDPDLSHNAPYPPDDLELCPLCG